MSFAHEVCPLSESGFACGRSETSPDCEQIERSARMCKKRNSVSTKLVQDSEQQKKSLNRKIRKDFYKVKQELGLNNFMFDDLRFSNIIDNQIKIIYY